jgi:hypothetical protein
MSKLLDYLNHLDKNADARTAHAVDPKASMQSFGLSQDEQDAMMTGDRQRVADACGIPVEDLVTLHTPNSPYNTSY